MSGKTGKAALLLLLGICGTSFAAAQSSKQYRYTIAPGGSVAIYNEYGPVTVNAGPGRQVVVTATPVSSKVEVEPSQSGNRIEFRTHASQRVTESDGRVAFEVTLPADANLSVRVMNGAITAESLRGDVTLVNDAGAVSVRNFRGGHVHVQTITGPATLESLAGTQVEVTTVGGDVSLTNVSGPKVAINSNRGLIRYSGDPGENGDYSLINNTGDIEFTVPATASMDLTARSVSGTVENDFPFQPKLHSSFASQPGRAFAGTSNTGSSVVELRSFSGTIRVKKR